MQVNEIKHQVKLSEWKQRIAECHASGRTVTDYCREQGFSKNTYYRWEREIVGRIKKSGEPDVTGLTPLLASEMTRHHKPEFAEIAMTDTLSAKNTGAPTEAGKFYTAAIIHIGRMEIKLSNAAAIEFMQQLKEWVQYAE